MAQAMQQAIQFVFWYHKAPINHVSAKNKDFVGTGRKFDDSASDRNHSVLACWKRTQAHHDRVHSLAARISHQEGFLFLLFSLGYSLTPW